MHPDNVFVRPTVVIHIKTCCRADLEKRPQWKDPRVEKNEDESRKREDLHNHEQVLVKHWLLSNSILAAAALRQSWEH